MRCEGDKVKNNNVTLMTEGVSHPQVAAPG